MPEPTPAPTTAAAPAQKAKWEFADGKVYEADSPEKLLEMVGERYNNMWPEFQRIKQENDTLKTQATTGIDPTPQVEPEDKFSQKKYFELLSTDPLEATRYVMGFTPEYQTSANELKQMRQIQEANTFRAMHPEFQQDEASVNKLAEVCNTLYPKGEIVSAQQMAAAYALMSYKPQETTVTTTNPQPPIPPAQSASVPAPAENDPNKMSQDQLKEYIRRLEAAGAR